MAIPPGADRQPQTGREGRKARWLLPEFGIWGSGKATETPQHTEHLIRAGFIPLRVAASTACPRLVWCSA